MFVVVVASSASAEPPLAKDAGDWCADHPREELRLVEGGSVERGTAPDVERLSVRWRGRLDRDRRTDMILDEGACGTRECMLGGYVQCADGSYSKVLTQYAARVRVTPAKRGWATLWLEHVGDAERGRERARSWSVVRFGANGYD